MCAVVELIALTRQRATVRGAPAPLCPYSFVLCGPTTLAGADLVLLNGLMMDDGAKNRTLLRAAVPLTHGFVVGIASQQWRWATPEWGS